MAWDSGQTALHANATFQQQGRMGTLLLQGKSEGSICMKFETDKKVSTNFLYRVKSVFGFLHHFVVVAAPKLSHCLAHVW